MNPEYFPRVSEIVKFCYPDQFAGVPFATLKSASERGTYYHQIASEMMMARQFPKMHKFKKKKYADDYHIVNGIQSWADLHGIQPLAVETSAVHPVMRYRGTPDLLAKATNPKSAYCGKVLLPDFKFVASIFPSNEMQVVAYSHLPGYDIAEILLLVQIDPYTGKFREHRVYKIGNGHWMEFCSALGKILNGETK